jgi:hypothetical protein
LISIVENNCPYYVVVLNVEKYVSVHDFFKNHIIFWGDIGDKGDVGDVGDTLI